MLLTVLAACLAAHEHEQIVGALGPRIKDQGTPFEAGLGFAGYRLGDALNLSLEATRREPANDDAPDQALTLRAQVQF